MVTTTMPVAVISAGRSRMSRVTCSQRANGAEKAASPTMPLRMLIEVMPICTTESHLVGSSCRAIAWTAPESPASTMTCSLALRLAVSAISDMANKAFRKIRKSRRATSMRGAAVSGRQRSRIGCPAPRAARAPRLAMDYLVGDLQGCADALDRLLAEIDFSASRDRLYVLGDLVNRGPDSLGVLRRLRGLGDAAHCVLGNHDWHLLAVAAGVRPRHRSDTLDDILDAPDREAWLDWLRQQPHGAARARLADAACRRGAAMGPGADARPRRRPRAGAARLAAARIPRRDVRQRAARAGAIRCAGDERLRFTLNVLTRIRFVTADGTLEFAHQGRRRRRARRLLPPGSTRPAAGPPARRSPSATGRRSACSTGPTLLGLDTGCVWGGKLSAARIDGGAARDRAGRLRPGAAVGAMSPARSPHPRRGRFAYPS